MLSMYVEYLDLSYISGGTVKCYKHFGKETGCFYKVKHTFTMWPKNPSPDIYLREKKL